MDPATISMIVSIVVPIVIAILKEVIPYIIDAFKTKTPQPSLAHA